MVILLEPFERTSFVEHVIACLATDNQLILVCFGPCV